MAASEQKGRASTLHSTLLDDHASMLHVYDVDES